MLWDDIGCCQPLDNGRSVLRSRWIARNAMTAENAILKQRGRWSLALEPRTLIPGPGSPGPEPRPASLGRRGISRDGFHSVPLLLTEDGVASVPTVCWEAPNASAIARPFAETPEASHVGHTVKVNSGEFSLYIFSRLSPPPGTPATSPRGRAQALPVSRFPDFRFPLFGPTLNQI
jgi:hypothetical protein